VAVLRVDKAHTLINNPLYPSQRVCLRFPGQPCEHGATSEEAQEEQGSRSCSFWGLAISMALLRISEFVEADCAMKTTADSGGALGKTTRLHEID
jgi:hypothetical protein